MARYGMVIDTKQCVGCMDCVVACKTENGVPEGYNRDWIVYETTGTSPTLHMEIRSERCNHCDEPPCVPCCPCGASHVHERGGVVLVHHDKLRGQVHFLRPPGGAGARSRVCLRVPDALHALRRLRGPQQRREPPAAFPTPPRIDP